MPIDGQPLCGSSDVRGDRDGGSAGDGTAATSRSRLPVVSVEWPESPLFGKDRIATFERDFIADKTPHHETKDPYFSLIHEAWFCDKVLTEFGVEPDQRPDRQRTRSGKDRGGRIAAQTQRQGDHHRRSLFRGLRRPRLHTGARSRSHRPRPAPPLRVGRRGNSRRSRHRPEHYRRARVAPTSPHGRYRTRRTVPL